MLISTIMTIFVILLLSLCNVTAELSRHGFLLLEIGLQWCVLYSWAWMIKYAEEICLGMSEMVGNVCKKYRNDRV